MVGEPENFKVIPGAFALIEQSELDTLCRQVESLSYKPSIIVIDTLNRNLGGNESSEEDMGKFIKAADALKTRFGCTGVVVHHTGWNTDRERGHSSLRGAADTMISVSRMGERLVDGVQVECIKQKDYDRFDRFGIAYEKVGDQDESSLVLAGMIDTKELHAERKQERDDLELYDLLRVLPDSPNGLTVEEIVKAAGLKRHRCDQLLRKGVNRQCVVPVGDGVKGRPKTYYRTATGNELVQRCAGIALLAAH